MKVRRKQLQPEFVDSIQAVRDLPSDDWLDSIWSLGTTGPGIGSAQLWRWDAASTAADDGLTALLPTGLSAAGRWTSIDLSSLNRVGRWNAAFGSTTILADGIIAPTVTGTATARTLATTNFATTQRRIGSVSAATAAALCGFRSAAFVAVRGNAANIGGFKTICQFQCADTVTATRQFVGLSSSTAAPTNVEPSTLTNVIGIGHGAADTNLKLFASGATAQAPIDLGANFPINTTTDVYRLTLSCAPNDTQITWRVARLNTAFSATGSITAAAALPANTQALAWQMWRTNNATAVAVALDLSVLTLTSAC
jgi:hypothetical protein